MIIVEHELAITTGGTAIACAELLNEHFSVAKQNILILALIDLPALGWQSKLIRESGFQAASLVSYDCRYQGSITLLWLSDLATCWSVFNVSLQCSWGIVHLQMLLLCCTAW